VLLKNCDLNHYSLLRVRILSTIKSFVVPRGQQSRRVRFGVYRGLRLELDLASQMQIYLGLWERETYTFIREASSRCMWAIDVGAGRGELCLFLLRHSHAQKIFAFEPQQSETKMIDHNLHLNGVSSEDRFVVLSKFVGCSPTPDFVSLDSLDLDRLKPGFLKIDVDGLEMDVLRSGDGLLRSARMDILLETHSQPLESDCIDFLVARGFTCEVIKNAWWRVIVPELRPTEHNRWLWGTKH
jgi:hypothetical protein